jgi:hypothetical protein
MSTSARTIAHLDYDPLTRQFYTFDWSKKNRGDKRPLFPGEWIRPLVAR